MDRHRTILILAAAWISAGLLSWFVYATAVAPRTEPQKLVIVAARDMALGTRLTKEDVRLASLPERGVPKGAVTAVKDAAGRVLLAAVSAKACAPCRCRSPTQPAWPDSSSRNRA